jgi:hypothetical protein
MIRPSLRTLLHLPPIDLRFAADRYLWFVAASEIAASIAANRRKSMQDARRGYSPRDLPCRRDREIQR